MKLRRSILILTILAPALQAEPRLVTTPDNHLRATLGDQVSLSHSIAHDADEVITALRFDADLGAVEIIAESLEPGRVESRVEVILAVYDSTGLYHLPDMWIYYQDGDESVDSMRLPGAMLEIESILTPADTSFRAIKDLHNIRRPLDPLLAVLILLVIGVLVAAFLLIRKYGKGVDRKMPEHYVPPEEAHVMALRELGKLESENLIQQAAFKAFYSRLSWIVRAYYENRFLFLALEMTTREIVNRFGGGPDLDPDLQRSNKAILEQADLVKFARYTPDEHDAEQALNLAFRIVEHTKIEREEVEKNTEVEH